MFSLLDIFTLRSSDTWMLFMKHIVLKKWPNMEFFWSAFFRIRTEYGDLLSKFLLHKFSLNAGKNGLQKNSVFGHFLRIDIWIGIIL